MRLKLDRKNISVSKTDILKAIGEEDKLILRVNKTIKGLRLYPKLLDCERDKDLCELFNLLLFVTLFTSDLLISMKYLQLSMLLKNQIESNYYSRITSVLVYEYINDIKKLAGKHYRKLLVIRFGDKGKITLQHQKITANFNHILKVNSKVLKNIRVNVFAHRSKNAFEQTEIMLTVDNQKMLQLSLDIRDLSFDFISLVSDLMEEIT